MDRKKWSWSIYENEGMRNLYTTEEFLLLFRQTGVLDYICQHGTLDEMYEYLNTIERKDCIYCITDVYEDNNVVVLNEGNRFGLYKFNEQLCSKTATA